MGIAISTAKASGSICKGEKVMDESNRSDYKKIDTGNEGQEATDSGDVTGLVIDRTRRSNEHSSESKTQ